MIKTTFKHQTPCIPVTLSEVEMHSFNAKMKILR